MKFGLLMANWHPFARHVALYSEVVERAEELGFESFLVTDHLMKPHAEVKRPEEDATLDAWSLIAYLAAKTNRIKLGTLVTPIPLRNPAQLAKTVATIDVLSGGRVVLGVGAGWGQREFEGYGKWDTAAVRVQKTREALQLMKQLWLRNSVDFKGKFYSCKGAVLEPKPVQKPHPPIWVGAIHDKMLEITAELGDGWFPGVAVGATLDYYRQAVPKITRLLSSYRRSTELVIGVMGWFTAAGSEAPVRIAGQFERSSEIIEAYRGLGCEYFIAVFYPPERYVDMMEKFAREVVPSFR